MESKKTQIRRRKWIGSCLRKKAYTEGLANHLIKKKRKEGVKLYKYMCPHCFRYHLTRKSQDD